MESCFVVVDGARVHYWKAGAGPPVVMVHGLVADGASWQLNVPVLTPLRTVYAVDMLNMGFSARVEGAEAGLSATADWLGRVLDALGLGAVDLVGSSHGGAVSLMLAARQPERVRSMVLFSPANPFCQQPRPIIAFWNSWMGSLTAALIPFAPGLARDEAHRRVYADRSAATPFMLEGYHRGLERASVAHLKRIVRHWWADMAKLERGLGEAARVHTLLVWGAQDGVVSVASGMRLREVLGAEWLVLKRVGHLPFVEDAAGSNRALVEWFGRGEDADFARGGPKDMQII